MVRSMWSGVITFGMVTIPVKLQTATESHNVAFHQLHKKCDTRIREQRFCPHEEEVVEWKDIVKGFEYTKGQYVEITDEDLDELPLPSKQTIEVVSFVDPSEINPMFFDNVYYVEVEKQGSKPYQLLLDTMEAEGVVGLAKITFRTKERVCALRPIDGAIVLQTLLYEDEIRDRETSRASVSLTAQEKKMATSLISALKSKFKPSEFKDNYQEALKKMIQAKLKGKHLEPSVPSQPTAVNDLMEALRASIENARGSSKNAKSNRVNAGKSSKRAAAATKTKTPTKSKRKHKSAA
ncbi:MAG TPA: Ku protein [Oculatellaceae cyanobacterium]